MTEPKWYVARGTEAVGPYSVAELAEMATTGALARTDQVCPEGGPAWVAAATVPGLFTTPPPAPAAPAAPAAPPARAPDGAWERFTGGFDGAFGLGAKLAGWGCGTLVVLYIVLMVVGGLLKNVRDDTPPKPDVPVDVSFRSLGPKKGMVLKLTNTSAAPLERVTFTVTSEGGEKAGSISKVLLKPLAPRATFEVNRADLDGWELAPGERVQVWVPSGEYNPVEVVVPVKAPLR
jgi:GYF domain 2